MCVVDAAGRWGLLTDTNKNVTYSDVGITRVMPQRVPFAVLPTDDSLDLYLAACENPDQVVVSDTNLESYIRIAHFFLDTDMLAFLRHKLVTSQHRALVDFVHSGAVPFSQWPTEDVESLFGFYRQCPEQAMTTLAASPGFVEHVLLPRKDRLTVFERVLVMQMTQTRTGKRHREEEEEGEEEEEENNVCYYDYLIKK